MTDNRAVTAPPRARYLPARQCTRCGAVGTHYLTCPSLRLPSGHRLSEAPGPEWLNGLPASEELDIARRIGSGVRSAPGRPSNGPGHPDWPRPPQH
jgi:hypothetical protein